MPDRPVLVVEDDSDARNLVCEYLNHHGFPSVGARDGREGLAQLHAHRPCLILLDLSMPVMDGWQFRAEQQRISDHQLANVPVLVLSALSDCDVHARVLKCADVIRKPIDLDRMVAVVREHCGDEHARDVVI